MSIKVGINGFGRIGRLAFRRIQEIDDIEVIAINDLTDSKMLAHLLKYDTTQGTFNGDIEVYDGSFTVSGKKINVLANRNPEEIPWGELGVDIVLECTGFFTTKEKAELHLKGGAKKVVISAPATGDMKTIVFQVNHETLDGTETVISAASCTTNCLAPMAKALNDAFGVHSGLMTTIHAYTGNQSTLDAPDSKGNFRAARAAAENIVPYSTGAAKAIGLVLPELNGKLDGASQRVPVATGSVTELVTVLNKKVTVEEVNLIMKNASDPETYGYTEDEIVSSDIKGMTFGSLFDATQTKVLTVGDLQLVKTVAWYDNEMSYTAQLVRTLEYFAKYSK